MLIRREHLEGIVRGEISLAFRRWKRPTVKAGGSLHTKAGLLAIDAVEAVDDTALTDAAARRAGYADAEALRGSLRDEPRRTLYRVRLRYLGEDPRRALREDAELSERDREELAARLERLDRASRQGPWTHKTLRAIQQRPATLAATLAQSLGWERAWFKGNVRKLKAMGLTESLKVGYRLSPRGERYLTGK